jgi:ParB-like chromosome segregation protein Spo0J
MTNRPTTLPVESITVGPRHRKDMGDLAPLMRSIGAVGLLHPVVITPDRELVAGQRRLEACKRLGWDAVPVRVVDTVNLLQVEHDENEVRKDFAPSERLAIADAIEEQIGKRQGRRTELRGNCPEVGLVGNCPQVRGGEKTREVAACKAGFGSEKERRRTREVVINGAPELVEAMDAGQVSISAAAEVARLPHEDQREVVAQGAAAVAAKAKEVRESRPPKPPPQYPHSQMMRAWLDLVQGHTLRVRVEQGGIRKILAQRDQWDWRQVRTYLLPMIRDMEAVVTEFREEIERACSED